MNIADQIKSQFKTGSDLTRLLYINLGVFILLVLIKIIGNISGGPASGVAFQDAVLNWIAMPSDPLKLLTRPWTIFTYMFVHVGFGHLFWNLIVLYFTGTIFQEYLGGRRLMVTYLGGGVFGAILYFIVANISTFLGQNGILIGASAGVSAVLIALALYLPNLPVRLFFVLSVKLWHVAVGVFVVDLVGVANSVNPGGSLAHIGGAIFGFIIIDQLRKGNEITEKAYAYFEAIKKIFQPKPKLKTVYTSGKKKTETSHSKSDQKRLDEILDKIKESGYDKLSGDEKEFLFKFGKK